MVRIFDRGLAAVACGLLLVLLVTVLLGVVTRAAGSPLIWTDEGARFVMVWLASFGWMIAGRRRAHVRIRYFQDLLPPASLPISMAWLYIPIVPAGLLMAVQGLAQAVERGKVRVPSPVGQELVE
jgi:TRAP-type C4-dicarboxylate transport system permease small subunit